MGGWAGGTVPPWCFSPESLCWLTRKKETRGRKGKMEKKENCKIIREGGKCKLEEEKVQKWAEDFFFFFFFLFFFACHFLKFETTEICLGSTKMEISTGKKEHFAPGKVTLPLLKKSLLLLWCKVMFQVKDRYLFLINHQSLSVQFYIFWKAICCPLDPLICLHGMKFRKIIIN